MLLDDSGNNLALNGFGNKLDNFIQGSGGSNEISGLGGNDTLSGQGGFDFLTGGKGKDKLIGGLDRDFFDFNSAGESKRGGQRDVIEDFERGDNVVGDEIDLSGIDAVRAGAIRNSSLSAGKTSTIGQASCASSIEARPASCRATSTAMAGPISRSR